MSISNIRLYVYIKFKLTKPGSTDWNVSPTSDCCYIAPEMALMQGQ